MPKQINNNLSEEQKRVLLQSKTEAPFTGKYLYHDEEGDYKCANCDNPLFKSNDKYDSKSGWPSFHDTYPDAIKMKSDFSHLMHRQEVICANCDAHLGHYFNDGPKEHESRRFCINSAGLEFAEKKDKPS